MKGLQRFDAVIAQTDQNTTGIVVPPQMIERLNSGARPRVVALVNGYSYRTTVGAMAGNPMLPFSAEHRKASGLSGGDTVSVELQLDNMPRTVTIPIDLAEALERASGLREAFLKQAPSRQRADVDNITSARAQDTRSRRIAAIVARLGLTVEEQSFLRSKVS